MKGDIAAIAVGELSLREMVDLFIAEDKSILTVYEEFNERVWVTRREVEMETQEQFAKRNLAIMSLGLVGEAGEAAEHVKKHIRDGAPLTDEFIKELGDVLYYVTRCALANGYTLADLIRMNMEKLASRAERGKIRGDGDNR
jgi:NTP pyrophosphatase (non-canonical NTP hydrolase)